MKYMARFGKWILLLMLLLLAFSPVVNGQIPVKIDEEYIALIGPLSDFEDGVNLVTDATLANDSNQTALLFSNDGSNVSSIEIHGNDFVHIGSGMYKLTLEAAQVATLGELIIVITDKTLHCIERKTLRVTDDNIHDSLVSATDKLQVDLVEYEGNTGVDAEIESECTDALTTYDPPTKTELDTAETNLTAEIDANETVLDDLKGAIILLDTTIDSDDRNKTNCRLTDGIATNDAYIGMKIIINDNAGAAGEWVSRTITDYAASNKVVTWTPAITQDPENGGQVYIVAGDTKINVTADTILADTEAYDTDSERRLALFSADYDLEVGSGGEVNVGLITDTNADDAIASAVMVAFDTAIPDSQGVTVDSINEYVTKLYFRSTGNMLIDENADEWIFYMPDGSVHFTWDLFDIDGNPDYSGIFQRDRQQWD